MRKSIITWLICCVLLQVFATLGWCYTMPIGVPTPPFPADLDVARPTLPSPWSSNTAGFWYIKNGGTNSGNGYPGNPRDSIDPASLSAGDVVVLEVGTEYPDSETLTVDGTAENPIWIMSSEEGTLALCTGEWYAAGAYTIFDDIDWYGPCIGTVSDYADHVMIRGCDCRRDGTLISSYSSGVAIGGDYIVFYQNRVYNHGDWTAETDYDQHGIKVATGGANHVWVLNNQLYHNQGDGIQIGDQNNTPEEITYVYVADNTSYENLQSCYWTKNATHVVFSENSCNGIYYSPGGSGQCMGGQYDATDVWFLYNTMHDCYSGIKISGGSDGDGGPWYAIGNVIYDIESPESGASGSCNAYNYGAIGYRNAGGLYAFHNTIYEADSFLCTVPAASQYVRNNIFSNPLSTSLACPQINTQTYPSMDYNLYSQSSIRFGYDGGTAGAQGVEYSAVTTFAAGETQEQNSPTPASPLFTTPASADFTLQSGSPAIDASNPTIEAAYASYLSTFGVDIKVDISGASREASGTDWEIGANLYSEGGDTTAPSFSSATVNGTSAQITLSEDVVITGLDNGDFVMTGSTTGAVNLNSCIENAGVISCTAASSFIYGETVTLVYGGTTDEVEDLAGNDLAVFSGESVTNNTPDSDDPVLSSPSPSGEQACSSNPRTVTLSVDCSDNDACSVCKADTSDIDIDVMSITLSQAGSTWSGTSGSHDCGTSPTYYAKCEDAANNESAATTIGFSIAVEAQNSSSTMGGTGSALMGGTGSAKME